MEAVYSPWLSILTWKAPLSEEISLTAHVGAKPFHLTGTYFGLGKHVVGLRICERAQILQSIGGACSRPNNEGTNDHLVEVWRSIHSLGPDPIGYELGGAIAERG